MRLTPSYLYYSGNLWVESLNNHNLNRWEGGRWIDWLNLWLEIYNGLPMACEISDFRGACGPCTVQQSTVHSSSHAQGPPKAQSEGHTVTQNLTTAPNAHSVDRTLWKNVRSTRSTLPYNFHGKNGFSHTQ